MNSSLSMSQFHDQFNGCDPILLQWSVPPSSYDKGVDSCPFPCADSNTHATASSCKLTHNKKGKYFRLDPS